MGRTVVEDKRAQVGRERLCQYRSEHKIHKCSKFGQGSCWSVARAQLEVEACGTSSAARHGTLACDEVSRLATVEHDDAHKCHLLRPSRAAEAAQRRKNSVTREERIIRARSHRQELVQGDVRGHPHPTSGNLEAVASLSSDVWLAEQKQSPAYMHKER